MKTNDVFLKIVEMIKIDITPLVKGDTTEDEDTILTRVATPYDNLLYFLWASNKFLGEVNSPPIAVNEDESTLSWDKKNHNECYKNHRHYIQLIYLEKTMMRYFPIEPYQLW